MNLLILSIIIVLIIITIYSVHFYKIVIILSTIILVIVLTVIGYSLKNFKKNKIFPPITSDCPDHWVADASNCLNVKGLGTCSDTNFNTDYYNAHDGNCKKAEWAKNCGLTWQGITTNDNICDDSKIFDITY